MSERPRQDDDDFLDEAFAAYLRSCDEGQGISRDAFLEQFPEIAAQLRELMNTADLFQQFVASPHPHDENEKEARSQNGLTLGNHGASSSEKPLEDDDRTLPIESTRPLAAPHSIKPQNANDSSRDPSLLAGENTKPANSQFPLDLPSTIALVNPLKSLQNDDQVTYGPVQQGATLGDQPPTANPETGPQLPFHLGTYRLDEMLGYGGMGVVYKATQEGLNRQVAVKMIRSGALAGDAEVRRFRAEAQSAAKLKHPNIVTVHDFGFQNGHHYFSMDYVAGTDLAKKLAAGPLNPKSAARYVRDCALAVHYAHQNGILHRDLKPANVLIDHLDHVRLTDFGLAKQIDADHSLTDSGTAIGTPSYMAPEQVQSDGKKVDARVDVYALGAVLFALLTGRPPFAGDTVVQTFMQVIHRPPQHLHEISGEIPEDLDTIVQKCLEKAPEKRYRSARELADELERFLEGRPLHAKPRNFLQRQWHWFRDVPIVAALTGRKILDTTPTHRRFQAIVLGITLSIPGLLFSLFAIDQWNRSRMPSYLRVAGGVDDGLYNKLAEDLAFRITRSHQVDATVVSSEGSLENREKLLKGTVDLAPMQGSTIRGEQLGVIAPLYFEGIHILARRDKQIGAIGDLRDKRVAVGPVGSGSRVAVEMLFDAYDLEEENPERVHAPWNQLEQLDRIDAVALCIGPGSELVERLLTSGNFDLIGIPDALDVAEKHPALRPLRIEQDDYPTYPIRAEGIATVGLPSFMTTRMNASSVLVQATLEAIYAEPLLSPNLIPKAIAKEFEGMQLHPEARRYFGY